MPAIRYSRKMIDGVPVVVMPGEIDITTAGQLHASLLAAASHGSPIVVADMRGTQFCDSAGIHTLLGASKQMQAEGRQLRLVIEADGAVSRILTLTGTDRFLSCATSLEQALTQTPAIMNPPEGREVSR